MVKTTVLFLWNQLLAALIHLNFIYSGINLFLINDVGCKLCNEYMVAPQQEQLH